MKHNLLVHIVTLLLAFQITAISTNVFTALENKEVGKDACIQQKAKNKKNPLPVLPELEEEEEIITHSRNWSLISDSSNRLLSVITFGFHLKDIREHTLETSLPPPKA
ncbi:hypothetical protein [Fulvivirga lutea]|uniref:Uncharacterized protein n=1 Tax=Fulvivirga lutea TaxID=2810512 RepID=A0A974WDU7_9BACT|nr:hypothetical protein [Fulvivirga lutea]QSE96106.1 hypothetical protein JR347_10805 [Fulvivirga lutea]